MNKYITEGIGAFFLVLAVMLTSGPMSPLAVGLMYMAAIYASAHISGGHFNPSVSLGIYLRGKMERSEVPYYFLGHIAGAVLAALVGGYLLSCSGPYAAIARTNEPLCVLLAEFFGTFALVFVLLNVSTTRIGAVNGYYGLASGAVLTGLIYMFGNFSGGSFNPAVTFAQCIAGNLAWSDIWLYLVGEFLGAAAAATVFTITNNMED